MKKAIVFVLKNELKVVLKSLLKNLNVSEIVTPHDITDCINELNQDENAPIILEWTEDPLEGIRLLEASQGAIPSATRPIFLISTGTQFDLLSLSSEYNVSRVHTGELAPQALKIHLQFLVEQVAHMSDVQEVIHKICNLQIAEEYDATEAVLFEYINSNGKHPRVLAELVNNFIFQDNWEKALEYASELVQLFPSDLRGKNLLSRCLIKHRRIEEAIAIMQEAQVLNPYNKDRLITLGNSLLRVGKVQEAKGCFDDALTIDEHDRRAVVGMGTCVLLDSSINEALTLLRPISSGRELASIFNSAAIIATRDKNFDFAVQLYDQALNIPGGNDKIKSRLCFNKAIALYKAGKFHDARSQFAESFSKDPSFQDAQFNVEVLDRRIEREGLVVGKSMTKEKPSFAPVPDALATELSFSNDFLSDFSGSFDEDF